MTAPRKSLTRILICRTDNIGDVLLILPLIGYLKNIFPGITIDLLCRAYTAPIAMLCGNINQVYLLEDVIDARSFFRSGSWSCVIFAHPDRRLAAAARQAAIPFRIGAVNRLFNWLSCNKLVNLRRVSSRLHEAQLNFKLLRPLGIVAEPSLPQIVPWFGLQTRPPAAPLPDLQPGGFHVILHTKSNGNGREWPIPNFLALTSILQAQADIVFLLTGSSSEGDWLQQHAPALLAQKNVRNLCGTLDLTALATLITQADGLVASGTGPLHLSAALGRPTLGLFPPIQSIDATRWGALGVQAQSLCAVASCNVCNDPARCHCMQLISPQQVAKVVSKWKDKID